MPLNKISLAFAACITLVITVVVGVYRYLEYNTHNIYSDSTNSTNILFYGIILIVFLTLYMAIEMLFAYYSKHQIKKIIRTFPNDYFDHARNIGFKELRKTISGLQEKSDAEFYMFKEMENYRKEYIGNVSHELKTPLFSIQGYVDILKDGGIEDLSIRDKYLERIGLSVERLITIVKDLDLMHRLESGEIELKRDIFDVHMLIKEVFDLLDLEAQNTGAHLSLKTSHRQIFVQADKQKIAQVFINLLSNAIHYANRQEAKITVTTNIIKDKVEISVSDNGMGIRPEQLPRIFERFYRVKSSRSRKDGGSGLGLAIVKHILEAHGENIFAKSEYLEGTEFTFRLRYVTPIRQE
ncbi:MAG: GHKL domain-containing protein [Bergeyella sp.]|nr:GHKL domain-containing protein [Bergeyella sp.]